MFFNGSCTINKSNFLVVSENKSNSITKLLNVNDNEEGNNLTDQPCEIKEEKNNEYKDNTQDSDLESSSANSSQNLEESKTSGFDFLQIFCTIGAICLLY